MDELVKKIKTLYLEWYNSDAYTYKATATVLYKIGEMVVEVKEDDK